MRHISLMALEDLCRQSYFSRRSVEGHNGDVTVTYFRSRGLYQICLQLPTDEWQRVAGDTAERAAEQPAPAPTDRGTAETTIHILPSLIRSFSINDRRVSTLQRLESILERLPAWLDVRAARLVINEERVGERDHKSRYLSVAPERWFSRQVVYERCRRSGRLETVNGAAAESVGLTVPAEITDPKTQQVTVVPILAMGDFWGVLEIWTAESEGRGPLERSTVASRMIEQIIENAMKLQELTSIDKLTQIYNRNFYDRQVRIEIERATRSASKLSMLVLDIDDFKRLNDTLGHQKGDEALTVVADAIRSNLRKIDLPFRYGGEEFVILLPGTAEVEAVHTAERLRSVIADSGRLVDSDGHDVPLRVSIGAAVFPDHAKTEQELFAKADAALYRAKRKGKNRVEFYSD